MEARRRRGSGRQTMKGPIPISGATSHTRHQARATSSERPEKGCSSGESSSTAHSSLQRGDASLGGESISVYVVQSGKQRLKASHG